MAKIYAAKMQSAYREYHSSETALIRVVNDIEEAIDDRCESVSVFYSTCLPPSIQSAIIFFLIGYGFVMVLAPRSFIHSDSVV